MGLTLLLLLVLLGDAAAAEALQIDASPKVLLKSGDSVTISWNGLKSPSDLDWVGIYTPPDSLNENFIGYVLLSSLSGWKSGNGSLQIPLVNMRAPYQFRLFQGSAANSSSSSKRYDADGNLLPSTEVRLAVTEHVEFKSYNEPTQVHLSLTSQPGQVNVMFNTRDPLDCFVVYGSTRSRLDTTVATISTTYTQDEMCDGPANTTLGWRSPGFIHTGVITGLVPSKRYFYQVGSKEGPWSEIFSFVSPPPAGDETHALLFGDMGTDVPYKTFLWPQAESVRTLKWLQRDIKELGEIPTFISHIGDISYARGYAWIWDEFFHRVQPVAARVPYIVCIGNHEYDWPLQPWKPDWAANVYHSDGGGECGVPYSLRFTMPGNSSLSTGSKAPATRNLYFSLDYGLVHFVYISTETNFETGSEQHNFLANDLSSVNRSTTPYVVVLGHRPMYTSNHEVRDAPTRQHMMAHIEPVLVKYQVDLALWGHVHKYDRICPMSNNTCGDGNPVHVVIGMGGQDWQPIWEPRSDRPDLPIFPQPEWSLYRSEDFGYVRIHANRQRLRMAYVGNGDGNEHDVLIIPSRFNQTVGRSQRMVVQHPGVAVLGSVLGASILAVVAGAAVYKLWRRPGWDKLDTGLPPI